MDAKGGNSGYSAKRDLTNPHDFAGAVAVVLPAQGAHPEPPGQMNLDQVTGEIHHVTGP